MRHADVRRTVERLRADYGDWPLSEARLAVTADEARPRVVLREDGRAWALGARGWQQLAVLQDGQIAESGTHDELLARGALYARFHNTAFEPKRAAVQFP